jgi:bis(5'-nucleosyl)-tetraphosphatase (symmetrical)
MHYLIGDIQGCDGPFERLLERIGFSPSRDSLTVLGDMVNRGPHSLKTLRRLASLGSSAQAVLGNHDLHLLAVAAGARRLHATDTLAEILDAPDAAHWLAWLRHCPLALQTQGWLCVHAGVLPQWSAAQTLTFAQEVSDVLQSENWQAWLHTMYGNQPVKWHDDLQGSERWRCIVNALTRIRYCTPDGAMDFKVKESIASAPTGLIPWFDLPTRQTAHTPLAFGHWSTLGLINQPRLLALDTGCVWGGCLSAVRVDGGRREVFQVTCA